MSPDLEMRVRVSALYADYAACLDAGDFAAWPDFFTEDARYRLVPRENHDRGLPLATMDLEGRGMLLDRVYGVTNTLFHAPYHQRHILGPARIWREHAALRSEANYLVIRTKRDGVSEVFNTGRYLDRIVVADDRLLFAEKTCVFDSELVLNSIIYPI